MLEIETELYDYMFDLCRQHPDPSHDILHVERVVNLTRKMTNDLAADPNISIPAAYLHDAVYILKSDPRRSQASKLSADKAVELLQEFNYPKQYLAAIHHAVSAHSFSANIPAESLEAKIVQDADRLDALGAIGSMRCFAFSGLSKRALYSKEDPFCISRQPDDKNNTLDHFYIKLFKLIENLNTDWAKEEALKRVETMKNFISSLKRELGYS